MYRSKYKSFQDKKNSFQASKILESSSYQLQISIMHKVGVLFVCFFKLFLSLLVTGHILYGTRFRVTATGHHANAGTFLFLVNHSLC